jgi:tRNA (guanine37-N1)-methyltransferase
VVGKAIREGKVEVYLHDLHNYAINKHKQIDDYPYGGGGGMVLRIEPIAQCIRSLQSEREYDEVIYLTADGEVLTQSLMKELSLKRCLLLLCGRYKGVDERVRTLFVTREISVGDYILSGGELAALILIDGIVRILPGVVGDIQSVMDDSFEEGLLGYPVYTRPREFEGLKVPEVLLGGNHQQILEWRLAQQIERTKARRPDLWERYQGKKS